MNVVKILLVLGLGYVALTQKVEKTRNMLLVVTGLLAFCMFSVEGFTTINFGRTDLTVNNDVVTIPGSPENTIRGVNGITYTFTPGPFNINTGNPAYDCPANNVKDDNRGTAVTSAPLTAANINDVFSCVSKQKCKDAGSSLTCSSGTKKSGDSDYCDGAACASSDFGAAPTKCCAANETCGTGKTRLSATCPDNYTDKANASCAAATCVAADFTSSGACCELPCSDDKCTKWFLFGGDDCPKAGECGEKCEDGLFWDTYCEP